MSGFKFEGARGPSRFRYEGKSVSYYSGDVTGSICTINGMACRHPTDCRTCNVPIIEAIKEARDSVIEALNNTKELEK